MCVCVSWPCSDDKSRGGLSPLWKRKRKCKKKKNTQKKNRIESTRKATPERFSLLDDGSFSLFSFNRPDDAGNKRERERENETVMNEPVVNESAAAC